MDPPGTTTGEVTSETHTEVITMFMGGAGGVGTAVSIVAVFTTGAAAPPDGEREIDTRHPPEWVARSGELDYPRSVAR
jgi:hypothetical protein